MFARGTELEMVVLHTAEHLSEKNSLIYAQIFPKCIQLREPAE